VQLGISESPAFKLKGHGWKEPRNLSSFLIPPDVSHKLWLSGDDDVLMIWLDPERSTVLSIGDSDTIYSPLEDLETKLISFCNTPLDCGQAKKIRDMIVGGVQEKSEGDERILETIFWIKEHLVEQTITAEDLAGKVYLSKSRFMHLFSDQVGIPVRKYILWQRLKHALVMLSDGSNITESAHGAGFTDSPHMNRTFNAMFGITPSKIFKNSRFIQVFAC
ncbi:MAG: AraC family transcriptional regulator, partial [Balneolaceae bacterium]